MRLMWKGEAAVFNAEWSGLKKLLYLAAMIRKKKGAKNDRELSGSGKGTSRT